MSGKSNNNNNNTPQEKRLLLRDFGIPNACDPIMANRAKEGEIHWSWCPTWSWMIAVWLVLAVLLIVALILMLLAGTAGIVLGVLMLIVVITFMCLLGNYQWNTSRFQAISLARGKRDEARALWANVDDNQKFRAKDAFFSSHYGGKRLVVLRDGTVESYGSHKDDLFELLEEGGDSDNKDDNKGGGGEVADTPGDEGYEEVELTEAGDGGEGGSAEDGCDDRDV